MPETRSSLVAELLRTRRFVIIQGPPGTGKTRMARQILADQYGGFGRSVQFHPSTTYENFVGGLAPLQDEANGDRGLGFRFAPKSGFLLDAAAQAAESQSRRAEFRAIPTRYEAGALSNIWFRGRIAAQTFANMPEPAGLQAPVFHVRRRPLLQMLCSRFSRLRESLPEARDWESRG